MVSKNLGGGFDHPKGEAGRVSSLLLLAWLDQIFSPVLKNHHKLKVNYMQEFSHGGSASDLEGSG